LKISFKTCDKLFYFYLCHEIACEKKRKLNGQHGLIEAMKKRRELEKLVSDRMVNN